MFGLKMVRFGSPDLRTSALGVKLGVKRVRGSVSPYSRVRDQKKAHFGQNSKFDPRSIFLGIRCSYGHCWRLPALGLGPGLVRQVLAKAPPAASRLFSASAWAKNSASIALPLEPLPRLSLGRVFPLLRPLPRLCFATLASSFKARK